MNDPMREVGVGGLARELDVQVRSEMGRNKSELSGAALALS